MEKLNTQKGIFKDLSKRLYQEEKQYMSPGLQEVAQLSQLAIKEAKGRWLIDVDDRRYLDFMAGVAVCSLGHSHPKYISAMKDQLERFVVGSFTSENRLKRLKLIASITPKGLDSIQLYSGGAEAVEAAIRLAKSYTKKFEILGFCGGFLGKT